MSRGKAEGEAIFIPELCCEAEEGKVPKSLASLYNTAQCNSAADCLVLAANVLLIETGFLPQDCDIRAGKMPNGWRPAAGFYRLEYSHPLHENILVQVLAVLVIKRLDINAILMINGAAVMSWRLELSLDAYVTEEWAGGNAGLVYRQLQKLSCSFKEQLVDPVIVKAREELGLLCGLTVLPPELLLRIMKLLDFQSLLSLSETSRYLYHFRKDYLSLKSVVEREFEHTGHVVTFCDESELLPY